MREIIFSTQNFSKRDAINCRSGIPLQEFDGDSQTIENIVAAAIMKDTDTDTGEIKDISVLKTADMVYYTSISATICDNMEEVIDLIDEEGTINVRIDKRLSKGKREFLTIIVL